MWGHLALELQYIVIFSQESMHVHSMPFYRLPAVPRESMKLKKRISEKHSPCRAQHPQRICLNSHLAYRNNSRSGCTSTRWLIAKAPASRISPAPPARYYEGHGQKTSSNLQSTCRLNGEATMNPPVKRWPMGVPHWHTVSTNGWIGGGCNLHLHHKSLIMSNSGWNAAKGKPSNPKPASKKEGKTAFAAEEIRWR